MWYRQLLDGSLEKGLDTWLSHCGSPGKRPLQHWSGHSLGLTCRQLAQDKNNHKMRSNFLCLVGISFLLDIVLSFWFHGRLAFHCNFVLSDLCCLPNNCHEYQGSVIVNVSNICDGRLQTILSFFAYYLCLAWPLLRYM